MTGRIDIKNTFFKKFRFNIYNNYGVERSWLRYCDTSRKVAGSIPDGVTGIFH